MKELPPELNGKMRQYNRVLISSVDFKHAKLAANYIIKEQLHENYPQKSYIILEALNCSMIVAYCRPFSGNNKKVPDLPKRLLKVLNREELEIHEVVLRTRNKYLAHSDAEELDMEPVRWEVSGDEFIIPLTNWGLAPLTKEATLIFKSAAEKLHEETLRERMRLEPELIPYLRKADPENPFK